MQTPRCQVRVNPSPQRKAGPTCFSTPNEILNQTLEHLQFRKADGNEVTEKKQKKKVWRQMEAGAHITLGDLHEQDAIEKLLVVSRISVLLLLLLEVTESYCTWEHAQLGGLLACFLQILQKKANQYEDMLTGSST